MYNVQLSEFWKQRCTKESIHNAPYLFDTEDTEDVASVTSGRTPSMVSVASTATQQKVRVHTPTKINSRSAEPPNSLLFSLAFRAGGGANKKARGGAQEAHGGGEHAGQLSGWQGQVSEDGGAADDVAGGASSWSAEVIGWRVRVCPVVQVGSSLFRVSCCGVSWRFCRVLDGLDFLKLTKHLRA